ncbi:phosphatidylethanolamine-binding protein [Talaromyces proteolyticus]|uniref:Phosphatidylethanolamine-binding protein n=1 Tax=Talaromyces proteolyticus TaxID=1131652 RepID=A0AAD4KHU7_9EURO|nr:phosphatidylethanolamine-binding protein [Talaromyces proteolyticus]KAH8692588.1 phosphatidylethanolamine-binding protein [Talaromyces proteolyticus]
MDYIERLLAWTLSKRKGHDAGLISKTKPFEKISKPTITLECPDIGPSGSRIPPEYSFFQTGHFPTLKWTTGAESSSSVKEWLLVVEDPDAPLAEPVTHGLYYSIPAAKTSVSHEDFESSEEEGAANFTLKGGFKYGLNRRKNVYIPPRGLLGHGPHRYFFQIIGLGEPLDTSKLSPAATKAEIVEQMDGKLVAWGEWIGVWERS